MFGRSFVLQFLPASPEEKALRPYLPNVTYDEEADKGNWIRRVQLKA